MKETPQIFSDCKRGGSSCQGEPRFTQSIGHDSLFLLHIYTGYSQYTGFRMFRLATGENLGVCFRELGAFSLTQIMDHWSATSYCDDAKDLGASKSQCGFSHVEQHLRAQFPPKL